MKGIEVKLLVLTTCLQCQALKALLTEHDIKYESTDVDLLVNSSPRDELWVMPSLVSRNIGVIRRFCAAHGLRLGQIHEVAYPGLSSGLVLRQYPPAGSPLSRSDIISVWVSQ